MATRSPAQLPAAKRQLKCVGPGSRDAGEVRLVEDEWAEDQVTFHDRPMAGRPLGAIGPVAKDERIERRLTIGLGGRTEVSFALKAISVDGLRFSSREGQSPPELVIACER